MLKTYWLSLVLLSTALGYYSFLVFEKQLQKGTKESSLEQIVTQDLP